MSDVSRGMPIVNFKRPGGIVSADVDAFTGLRPGPYTTRTVTEIFVEGTVPTRQDNYRVTLTVDAASGLRWRDGCVGPAVERGFLDFSKAEAAFPAWKKFTDGWAGRAARGAGVRGGPEDTRSSYFYNGAFAPFGRTWGGSFAPSGTCPLAPPPVDPCDPPFFPPFNPFEPPAQCRPNSFPPSVTPSPAPSDDAAGAAGEPVDRPPPAPRPGG
jgi:hypothetical protein